MRMIRQSADMHGNELKVGDRVYAPPHSYGDAMDGGLFSQPIIDGRGEETLTPAVRGRITDFYWSPKNAAWFLEILDPDLNRVTFKRPQRCKKQAGRTTKEKQDARVEERLRKIKERWAGEGSEGGPG